MKDFLKQPKAIFIGIALLLNLGSLALVFTGKIDFTTFVTSISTVSAAVFGLYQFYIKKAIITEVNTIVNQANAIQDENLHLRKEIDRMNLQTSIKKHNSDLVTKNIGDTCCDLPDQCVESEAESCVKEMEVTGSKELSKEKSTDPVRKPKRKYNKKKKTD